MCPSWRWRNKSKSEFGDGVCVCPFVFHCVEENNPSNATRMGTAEGARPPYTLIYGFMTQKYFMYIFLFHTLNCRRERSETMRWLPARDKFLPFFCHLLYGGVRIFSRSVIVLFCFFFVCLFLALHIANDFYAIRFDPMAKVRMSLGFLSSSLRNSRHCNGTRGTRLFMITKRSHFNRVFAVQTTVNTLHKLTRTLFCCCCGGCRCFIASHCVIPILICMRGTLHFMKSGDTMWEIDEHFVQTWKCYCITASLAAVIRNWVVRTK